MESVYLSSSKSAADFPDNHGGDFYSKLNHAIRFDGQRQRQYLKVALGELFYIPGSWDNVREEHNYYDVAIENYAIVTYALRMVHAYRITQLSETFRYTKPSIAYYLPDTPE